MGSPGYSWLQMDGELWRVYALVSADTGDELQLAERAATRGWFPRGRLGLWLLGPASLLLVFAAGLLLVRACSSRCARSATSSMPARLATASSCS